MRQVLDNSSSILNFSDSLTNSFKTWEMFNKT
jgi:hypothetical protein